MPADDTGRHVLTVAGAWEGSAWSRGAACGKLLDLPVEGGGNVGLVAGGECAGRNPGDLPRSCRTDAVAAPQRLQ